MHARDIRPILEGLVKEGLVIRSINENREACFHVEPVIKPAGPVMGEFEMAQYRREVKPFKELVGYDKMMREAMVRR